MKIGIIGTGHMGGTLGRLWAGQGHKILFGSRYPAKARIVMSGALNNIKVVTIAEAAHAGEVILLATPWNAAHEALEAAGPIAGKILIDCTNPWSPDGEGLLLAKDTSAAETIAEWQPYARVVKAFNTIYWQHLNNPVFGVEIADALFCGNDPQAKAAIARLAQEINLQPVDAGPLKMARYLEALAYLWVYLAFREGRGSETTFKLINR
jgi:NADPH-dependent F420 reductase